MFGSGRLWANPQGNAGGEGGGGTPSNVSWESITNKPDGFKPEYHEHELKEVEGLQDILNEVSNENTEALNSIDEIKESYVKKETGKGLSENNFTKELEDTIYSTESLSISLSEELDGKVDKITGKSLSTNDFTDMQKLQLEEINKIILRDTAYVTSIEGKTGAVTLKELGLDTVTKDIAENSTAIKSLQATVSNKVNKEEGKELSSNDFTDELKEKLENIDGNTGGSVAGVVSINGRKGEVVLTQEDVGLVNALETETFEQRMLEVDKQLNSKVTKDGNKQLSTNDFTNEYKEKIDNLPQGGLAPVTSIGDKKPDSTGNISLEPKDVGLSKIKNVDYALDTSLSAHTGNHLLHLSEEDRASLHKVDNLETELSNKVDKDGSKQLSTNDFTDVDKKQISDNKTNLEQHISDASKHMTDDDRELLESVSEFEEELNNKVTKEEGKGLSSNDYTTAEKEKLATLSSNDELLHEHIENKKIHVTENQLGDIGDIPRLREEHVALQEALADKVDVDGDKQLSTNDYTDEDKAKVQEFVLDNFVKTINNKPPVDNNITITKETIDLGEVLNVRQASEIAFEAHAQNKAVHIAPEERENLQQIPSIQDDIEALEKALGEGGNVPSDTIFEELVEGKIYKLGDTIYDVINGNKISGDLSLRFFNDNKSSFLEDNTDPESGRVRLINNHFIVSATGYFSDMADYLNTTDVFQGMLTKIIDLQSAGTPNVTINKSRADTGRKMATVFQDNVISMEINPRHIVSAEDHSMSPKQTAKISLNFDYTLNLPQNLSVYSVAHQVVANQIHFTEYEDFAINVKGEITYSQEEFDKAGGKSIHLGIKGQLYNNIIKVYENTKYGDIIYNIPDAELFVDQTYENGEVTYYSAGLAFQVAHNTFDRETARRFTGELTYTPERMKDKQQPIFKNIHLDHYLNAVVDTLPKVHGDKNELDEKLVANTSVPNNEVSVKNSVVLNEGDPIESIPDGTIVFMIRDDFNE